MTNPVFYDDENHQPGNPSQKSSGDDSSRSEEPLHSSSSNLNGDRKPDDDSKESNSSEPVDPQSSNLDEWQSFINSLNKKNNLEPNLPIESQESESLNPHNPGNEISNIELDLPDGSESDEPKSNFDPSFSNNDQELEESDSSNLEGLFTYPGQTENPTSALGVGEIDQESDWAQILGQNSPQDDFSKRIDGIQNDAEDINPRGATTPISPFVNNESIELDSNPDSLFEKVKDGSVSVETLKSLLTSETDENELKEIVQSLGVDWDLVAGNSPEKTIENVINYFKVKGRIFEDDLTTEKPNFVPRRTEEEWLDSDSMLQSLQESFALTEAAHRGPVKSASGYFKQNYSRVPLILKVATVGLSIIIVILIVIILYFSFGLNLFKSFPAPKAIESAIPIKLTVPGDISFDLNIGQLGADNSWNPTTAEWLSNTNACRFVAIPWDTHREDLFKNFNIGEIFNLSMNDGTQLIFSIDKLIQTIQNDALLQQVNQCKTPSLIVILAKQGSGESMAIWSSLKKQIPANQSEISPNSPPSP